MKSSPHPSSLTAIPRNSFGRTLLRLLLHNSSALAPANLFDGITYGPNRPKSRKSFVALLLPHLFPVNPLLHYSYKKMRGGACLLHAGQARLGRGMRFQVPIFRQLVSRSRPSGRLEPTPTLHQDLSSAVAWRGMSQRPMAIVMTARKRSTSRTKCIASGAGCPMDGGNIL
jgi:hypothetical protein